ncbi:hypothetical protein Ahy_B02g058612 [Arachis hypogaea]|uniref:FAR1 domain-containing protein n=1 Tax=Arachis hypogaea TaxID=3818 RepID=A0A445AEZ3_ARAHY|nr:hypothetical protein Ahy_B02g058612 [Arachis hypogaea]
MDSPDEVVVSQTISDNMENYTSSNEVINQSIGDEELDPEEGMTGFVVKIRTTGWETKNGQKVVVNHALHCNRDGYHTSHVKAPKRRKIVASTNCKARCYLALDKMTGQWRISRVEVSHSHSLNPKLSGMYSANCQLSMHVKDLIQQHNQAGIRPSKTYQALANATGGPANLTFTEKDISHKLVGYRRFDQLNTCMKRIVFESKSKDSFERDWHDFIEEYDLHNSRWLNDNMFADRHMWVPVFFKDEFWTSMRSTQHSESMHAVFDKYLNNKSFLLQFVHHCESMRAWHSV